TLRKDKETAKYVNSPESVIYHKSNVLYGLYQARKSIVANDKCILVEGYMDVISMHQSGVENVVASSGTALTEGQIRLIKRFTSNVTVIYDSDAAGIKASLRGIDMLLAEGMNIKVLLLPDGDDPDSFAQSHSSSEVEEYIASNETDFIRFKTAILLEDVKDNDPISRSRVINDIVRSISVIPDDITRNVYVKECSRLLSVDEKVLTMQVARLVSEKGHRDAEARQRAAGHAQIDRMEQQPEPQYAMSADKAADNDRVRFMRPFEREVLRYVLKYGMLNLCDTCDDEGNVRQVTVLEYVETELAADAMEFTNADFAQAFNAARTLAATSWPDDHDRKQAAIEQQKASELTAGIDAIRMAAATVDQTSTMETKLKEQLDLKYSAEMDGFCAMYIERSLGSSADDVLRRLTTELVSEKYQLSKVHSRYSRIETEQDRLADLLPRAIYVWKDAILEGRMRDLKDEMQQAFAAGDSDRVRDIMMRTMELKAIRTELAKYLGERIITAR
ncbi:MAG: toprim domain-containing protein, partial [Muribaculaceae bacterium]|nr:toprim domain-containing protein [Muribaculaceae bacterium]